MHKKLSGFTIVELLVVIVVIAILATISIVAYNGVQNRAKDVKRQNDIAAIRKSLKLYLIDNERYPDAVPNPGESAWETSTDSTFLNSLSTYGRSMPKDPVNTSDHMYAYYRSVAGSYGCPASAGGFYVLRIVGLEYFDGRDISDLGVCAGSGSLSSSRTPSKTQAVFFGFEK